MKKNLTPAAVVLVAAFAFVAFTASVKPPFVSSGPAYAQDDWKKEFDDVCAGTQDAMLFDPEKLKELVARCDALEPRIEKLDGSQRKVMLKRLRMCRDLYRYVLQSKEGN